MTKPVDPAVSEYMAKIGRKGGKRGRGSKKAHAPEVYKEIWARRRAKKERAP
jgi:general stress protein YciG